MLNETSKFRERQIPYDFTHVESNEQTEVTSKTDRLIDGDQMTASGGVRLACGVIEEKGKRTHGHAKHCDDRWGEGSIRGLNGNRKYTIKIKLKNKINIK